MDVTYRFSGFSVDAVRRLLLGPDGQPIALKPRVFDTLLYLIEHRGELLEKQTLLDAIWPHVVVEENNLNQAISTLRRVLGESRDEHRFIVTEPGRGYRFVARVETVKADVPSAAAAEAPASATGGTLVQRPAVGAAALTSTQLANRRWRWIAVGVVAVAVTSVAAWNLMPGETPAPPVARPSVARFQLDLAPGQRLSGGTMPPLEDNVGLQRPSRPSFALSPDGRYLVYAATDGETQRLYRRRMDELESTPIPGTEGGLMPSFSPDSGTVVFFTEADDELKRVPTEGGEVRTIAMSGPGVVSATSVHWTQHDTLLMGGTNGIYELPVNGGELVQRTRVDRSLGELFHGFPQRLPNGRAILFGVDISGGVPSRWAVVVEPMDGGERRIVVEGGSHPVYLPSGHIVFARSGSLLALPFDATRLEATGAPVVVVEDVMHAEAGLHGGLNSGTAQFSVANTGTLAYVAGGIYPAPADSLVWIDRRGEAEPLPLPPARYLWPRFSPDGTQLVYGIGVFGGIQLWIYDIKFSVPSALTERAGTHMAPVWSPDGKRVAYFRFDENPGLFSIAADGSGPAERISNERGQPSSWSIDDRLAYVTLPPERIRILRMDGTGEPEPFGPKDERVNWPAFSPDARWLAYGSFEADRPDVYVRQFPNGPVHRISVDGGLAPLWSRDGRELFYVSGAPNGPQVLMTVDIPTDPTFRRELPRPLFEGSYNLACLPVGCYDVSPDGQRFVAIQRGRLKPEPVTSINVVLNWFEELEERVSAR